MIRPLTIVTFLMASSSGLYLYECKHEAQVLDRTIEKTVKDTGALREKSRLLAAEWTLLNDPETLRRYSDTYLKLSVISPAQFTSLDDLDSRLPPVQVPPSHGETDEDEASPATDAAQPPAPASAETPIAISRNDVAPAVPHPATSPTAAPKSPAPVRIAERKTGATKPSDAAAARTPPNGDTRLADARLADVRPADARLADMRSASSHSADQRQPEPRLPEPRLSEQHAADPRLADQHSADPRPVEQRAAEQRAGRFAEARPAEPRPVEARSGEARAADVRSSNARSADAQPPAAVSAPRPTLLASASRAASSATSPAPLVEPVMAPMLTQAPFSGSLLGMARGTAPVAAPRPVPINATRWSNTN